PPPILNLHKDKPIPIGLPLSSVSVLNKRSATWFFFLSSAHCPTNLPDQQSDAPKLWIVCLTTPASIFTRICASISVVGFSVVVGLPQAMVCHKKCIHKLFSIIINFLFSLNGIFVMPGHKMLYTFLPETSKSPNWHLPR